MNTSKITYALEGNVMTLDADTTEEFMRQGSNEVYEEVMADAQVLAMSLGESVEIHADDDTLVGSVNVELERVTSVDMLCQALEEEAPDKYCITTGDGGCIGPNCLMHRDKGKEEAP